MGRKRSGVEGKCFVLQVPCPVCRLPFRTPVRNMPMNFVVQDVISESLQSGEVVCQACSGERKLELATTRCQDCLETLCDCCSTQHAYTKDYLRSLVEQKCNKHQQKLELYCIDCQTNMCVVCFSETHQSHKCDAIVKMAERLTAILESDVENLRSCGLRFYAVLEGVLSQKIKYEKHFSDLEESANSHVIGGERLRAAEEVFQLEKARENVDNFTKTKMIDIKATIQRNNSGEAIDGGQLRSLVHDVEVLLGVVILELSSHAGRLREALSDVDKLKTKATNIICSPSSYDVTDNTETINRLHEEIITALLLHTGKH